MRTIFVAALIAIAIGLAYVNTQYTLPVKLAAVDEPVKRDILNYYDELVDIWELKDGCRGTGYGFKARYQSALYKGEYCSWQTAREEISAGVYILGGSHRHITLPVERNRISF